MTTTSKGPLDAGTFSAGGYGKKLEKREINWEEI
jgi:hypothetical protein